MMTPISKGQGKPGDGKNPVKEYPFQLGSGPRFMKSSRPLGKGFDFSGGSKVAKGKK